jgi:hypothetical protein
MKLKTQAIIILALTNAGTAYLTFKLFTDAVRDQKVIEASLDECTTKWDVKSCTFYALPSKAPMAEKPELPEVLQQYVDASSLQPFRVSNNPSAKGVEMLDEPAYN